MNPHLRPLPEKIPLLAGSSLPRCQRVSSLLYALQKLTYDISGSLAAHFNLVLPVPLRNASRHMGSRMRGFQRKESIAMLPFRAIIRPRTVLLHLGNSNGNEYGGVSRTEVRIVVSGHPRANQAQVPGRGSHLCHERVKAKASREHIANQSHAQGRGSHPCRTAVNTRASHQNHANQPHVSRRDSYPCWTAEQTR
ncbi:hypothetical protein BTJ68_03987 [Hortaea werneckii EXF-2000]|uniref:Uncharacterized protein n=1 Tax=Hortaea werneckii EXF-2000 TaxID=1157616 RepID=A0A1Z5TIQ3_HORWE|nr:hypothetical protein BTJ68_03987 [Hortaea werneckii EXF-2000]